MNCPLRILTDYNTNSLFLFSFFLIQICWFTRRADLEAERHSCDSSFCLIKFCAGEESRRRVAVERLVLVSIWCGKHHCFARG